jgi:hypothetical protein
MEFLDGKKTYLIAAVAILVMFLRNGLGWEIPGVPADPNWLVHALGFAGLGTSRAAIAKVGA